MKPSRLLQPFASLLVFIGLLLLLVTFPSVQEFKLASKTYDLLPSTFLPVSRLLPQETAPGDDTRKKAGNPPLRRRWPEYMYGSVMRGPLVRSLQVKVTPSCRGLPAWSAKYPVFGGPPVSAAEARQLISAEHDRKAQLSNATGATIRRWGQQPHHQLRLLGGLKGEAVGRGQKAPPRGMPLVQAPFRAVAAVPCGGMGNNLMGATISATYALLSGRRLLLNGHGPYGAGCLGSDQSPVFAALCSVFRCAAPQMPRLAGWDLFRVFPRLFAVPGERWNASLAHPVPLILCNRHSVPGQWHADTRLLRCAMDTLQCSSLWCLESRQLSLLIPAPAPHMAAVIDRSMELHPPAPLVHPLSARRPGAPELEPAKEEGLQLQNPGATHQLFWDTLEGMRRFEDLWQKQQQAPPSTATSTNTSSGSERNSNSFSADSDPHGTLPVGSRSSGVSAGMMASTNREIDLWPTYLDFPPLRASAPPPGGGTEPVVRAEIPGSRRAPRAQAAQQANSTGKSGSTQQPQNVLGCPVSVPMRDGVKGDGLWQEDRGAGAPSRGTGERISRAVGPTGSAAEGLQAGEHGVTGDGAPRAGQAGLAPDLFPCGGFIAGKPRVEGNASSKCSSTKRRQRLLMQQGQGEGKAGMPKDSISTSQPAGGQSQHAPPGQVQDRGQQTQAQSQAQEKPPQVQQESKLSSGHSQQLQRPQNQPKQHQVQADSRFLELDVAVHVRTVTKCVEGDPFARGCHSRGLADSIGKAQTLPEMRPFVQARDWYCVSALLLYLHRLRRGPGVERGGGSGPAFLTFPDGGANRALLHRFLEEVSPGNISGIWSVGDAVGIAQEAWPQIVNWNRDSGTAGNSGKSSDVTTPEEGSRLRIFLGTDNVALRPLFVEFLRPFGSVLASKAVVAHVAGHSADKRKEGEVNWGKEASLAEFYLLSKAAVTINFTTRKSSFLTQAALYGNNTLIRKTSGKFCSNACCLSVRHWGEAQATG